MTKKSQKIAAAEADAAARDRELKNRYATLRRLLRDEIKSPECDDRYVSDLRLSIAGIERDLKIA